MLGMFVWMYILINTGTLKKVYGMGGVQLCSGLVWWIGNKKYGVQILSGYKFVSIFALLSNFAVTSALTTHYNWDDNLRRQERVLVTCPHAGANTSE